MAVNGYATPTASAPAGSEAQAVAVAEPGLASQQHAETPAARAEPHQPPATDLFGQPVESPPPTPPPRRTGPALSAPGSRQPSRDEVPLVRNVTDEEIASFRALGAEVCLATEQCGQVWLVPEYTGRRDRTELRVDHAATLTAICAAFPGAKVVAFRKEPGSPPAQYRSPEVSPRVASEQLFEISLDSDRHEGAQVAGNCTQEPPPVPPG